MSPRAGGGSGASEPPSSAPPALPVSLTSPVSPAALVDELAGLLGDGARHEARFIVDEVLDSGAGGARPSVVPADAVERARTMAARRMAGEPLQYVFGHWPFRHLDLRVDARVLIPRPETEQVVEVALREGRLLLKQRPDAGLVAVDAGTGSGAIALALATELGAGAAEVWATDISAGALEVAAANVGACGAVAGAGAGGPDIALAQGSWLTPLPERLRGHVDLVVSNPPYVSADEWAVLDPDVLAEPRGALVAGPGRDGEAGLADVEAVLQQAGVWLGRPGAAVIELAPHQAAAAQERARQLGYDEVRVEPDLAGRPRALVARRRARERRQ
jgi:release factor glutamine methyltransferase